jgi:hypothetical protein
MPTKKRTPARSPSKPKVNAHVKPRTPAAAKPTMAKPATAKPVTPSNLLDAEDVLDEPLADNTGQFRITSMIASAQRGGDEDSLRSFADSSLVMRAQREGFRDEGPSIADAADDDPEGDTVSNVRAQRRALLVQRARQR